MTEKQTEALEKLNRGIQESRQEVQHRTMSLAQDYFGDSAESLKVQIKDDRAALEGLPDQIPGGREEAFQTMFQELMDNYSAIEQCIEEARGRVADLDTEQIRRQGEVEATDAARREARELGIDLTQVEGTGSEGRVTVDDVKDLAENMEDGAAGQAAAQAQATAGQATDRAEQLAGQAQATAGQATDQARQTAEQATDQAQQVVGQATDQAGQVAGQMTDQAGQVAGQAQDALGQAAGQVGQIADGGATEEINATDAAKREAEARGVDLSKVKGTGSEGRIVIWDVTEAAEAAESDPAAQLRNQAGDVAGQATQGAGDDASGVGEAATQVAGQADGAVGQAGGVGNQLAEQAISTARQTTDQAAQNDEEPKITKAAQRKAEEMGTDISKIQGTGAGGLITLKDVVGS